MLGRMNKKIRKIDVTELYIARIGLIVQKKSNFRYGLYEINQNLISRNLVIVKLSDDCIYPYDKYGISPINGLKYGYCNSLYGLLSSNVGQLMISSFVPLISKKYIDKRELTIEEIKEIEDELNKNEEPEKKEKEKIQDVVLEEIKKLADKAKMVMIEEDKQKFLAQINSLAEYYVKKLIEIKTNADSSLSLTDPEVDLIQECISKIYDLNIAVNKSLANNDTLKDYMALKRSLGSD